jgi:hypothetical protein
VEEGLPLPVMTVPVMAILIFRSAQKSSWPVGACPRAGLLPDPGAGHDGQSFRFLV